MGAPRTVSTDIAEGDASLSAGRDEGSLHAVFGEEFKMRGTSGAWCGWEPHFFLWHLAELEWLLSESFLPCYAASFLVFCLKSMGFAGAFCLCLLQFQGGQCFQFQVEDM